jgi:hypothetical protein
MLPVDASPRERILWAGLAAIVGIVHDGPEASEVSRFQRIEAACRSFGVAGDCFDAVAKRLGFHYYRPWDCYFDRSTWLEATLRDASPTGQLLH